MNPLDKSIEITKIRTGKEVLEKENSKHKTSKFMSIEEALEYQQRLINYGYEVIM